MNNHSYFWLNSQHRVYVVGFILKYSKNVKFIVYFPPKNFYRRMSMVASFHKQHIFLLCAKHYPLDTSILFLIYMPKFAIFILKSRNLTDKYCSKLGFMNVLNVQCKGIADTVSKIKRQF